MRSLHSSLRRLRGVSTSIEDEFDFQNDLLHGFGTETSSSERGLKSATAQIAGLLHSPRGRSCVIVLFAIGAVMFVVLLFALRLHHFR